MIFFDIIKLSHRSQQSTSVYSAWDPN